MPKIKLALLAIVAAIAMSIIPSIAFAQGETLASGQSDTCLWTIDAEGMLTITQKQEMKAT